jgi:hypothetical protein
MRVAERCFSRTILSLRVDLVGSGFEDVFVVSLWEKVGRECLVPDDKTFLKRN